MRLGGFLLHFDIPHLPASTNLWVEKDGIEATREKARESERIGRDRESERERVMHAKTNFPTSLAA